VANNRIALWVSNVLSAVKVLILILVVVTGWVVLGGGTKVEDPHSHFKNGFEGTRSVITLEASTYSHIVGSASANGVCGALINIIFAYQGTSE
jgi:amino acid transporter